MVRAMRIITDDLGGHLGSSQLIDAATTVNFFYQVERRVNSQSPRGDDLQLVGSSLWHDRPPLLYGRASDAENLGNRLESFEVRDNIRFEHLDNV